MYIYIYIFDYIQYICIVWYSKATWYDNMGLHTLIYTTHTVDSHFGCKKHWHRTSTDLEWENHHSSGVISWNKPLNPKKMIPSNHLPMKALKQATIRQSSPSLGKFSCGILESHTSKAPLGTTIFERRPCRQSHLCSWVEQKSKKKWRKLPSIGRKLHKIHTSKKKRSWNLKRACLWLYPFRKHA